MLDSESSLHYLVAVQSMFNYGVAHLLFECFKPFVRFNQEVIVAKFNLKTLGYIIASLIVDSLVGGLIGVVSAVLAMFILRYMSHQPEINFLKPLVIIMLAAFSYMTSTIFGFSPIISLIVYGLTAERLTFNNIEVSGNVTVPSILNGLATVLETLLFFCIGFEIRKFFVSPGIWANIWQFFLAVLVSIMVIRGVLSTLLFLLLNISGLSDFKISWKWQILIIIGGIRGAVSYAMVNQFPGDRKPRAEEFHNTTVLIIVVTTLFNGILLKIVPGLLNATEPGSDVENINKDDDAEETEH